MFIPLIVAASLISGVQGVQGYYTYQVAEVGDELKLFCSGKDITWSRNVNGNKESLSPPSYQISTSYRCGNPHVCGGYDARDTKVCVRSTLTLRNLKRHDTGTYFCSEGSHKGSYSFAYVVNVFDEISTPHIYSFEPLECNGTLWYACVASKTTARYEYFVSDSKEKIVLEETRNTSVVFDNSVQYFIRNNYISLYDFSILQNPKLKFGCRAYDSSGAFTEFQTGKTVEDLEDRRKDGTYEAYLIKMIGIGVGAVAGLIIIILVAVKFRKKCARRRLSNTDYSGLNSHNDNKL